jgi:hypothetical protein
MPCLLGDLHDRRVHLHRTGDVAAAQTVRAEFGRIEADAAAMALHDMRDCVGAQCLGADQLRHRELAVLLVDGADRLGLGDEEHRWSMGGVWWRATVG